MRAADIQREEVAAHSAELRMDLLLRELSEMVYGDGEAFRAAEHRAQLQELSWSDPRPTHETRRKLRPNWAWWKRLHGR